MQFYVDSFTNKAQFDTGFSEILKDDDVPSPTILDLTVMLKNTQVLRGRSSFVCYTDRLICAEYL